MNLIEAINSGKKYRRIGEKRWYEALKDYPDYVFSTMAVLAEDWEVESKPVTITREQFDAACDKATFGTRLDRDQLAKELGL